MSSISSHWRKYNLQSSQTDNWLIIKLLLFHLLSSIFCVTLEPRFGNVSQSLSVSRALVSLSLLIILIGAILHDMKFSLVHIKLLAERVLQTLCGLYDWRYLWCPHRYPGQSVSTTGEHKTATQSPPAFPADTRTLFPPSLWGMHSRGSHPWLAVTVPLCSCWCS